MIYPVPRQTFFIKFAHNMPAFRLQRQMQFINHEKDEKFIILHKTHVLKVQSWKQSDGTNSL